MTRRLIATLVLVFVAGLIASPAHAASATLTVPDAAHGDTITATLDGGNRAEYVYIQCFNPEYVFAAFYEIVDGQAEVGPLTSFPWPSGPADCTAEAGWFTAQGFGTWKVVASTTFSVT